MKAVVLRLKKVGGNNSIACIFLFPLEKKLKIKAKIKICDLTRCYKVYKLNIGLVLYLNGQNKIGIKVFTISENRSGILIPFK